MCSSHNSTWYQSYWRGEHVFISQFHVVPKLLTRWTCVHLTTHNSIIFVFPCISVGKHHLDNITIFKKPSNSTLRLPTMARSKNYNYTTTEKRPTSGYSYNPLSAWCLPCAVTAAISLLDLHWQSGPRWRHRLAYRHQWRHLIKRRRFYHDREQTLVTGVSFA